MVGIDDFRWITYSFVDSNLDHEHSDDEDSDHNHLDEYDDLDLVEDPICAYFTDRPFWRAREYFLQVCERRVLGIEGRWKLVTGEIARSIGKYVRLTFTYPFL
jgi:hypothetical protein